MTTPSRPPAVLERRPPEWLSECLGCAIPSEGGAFAVGEHRYRVVRGIPRAEGVILSDTQAQTRDAFGYLWHREGFESDAALAFVRDWYRERYGDVANAPWWNELGGRPLVVEAGTGAGNSGLELFRERLHHVRYLGVDISAAIDVAAERFERRGVSAAFLQTSLLDLPLPESAVDVIFSEGVLHHTDSTERAIKYLATRLKRGGRLIFYVYRRKGPIREFTDDFIREKLRGMSKEDGWAAMLPVTRLGEALGKLNVEVDVPEAIPLLDIPAGRIDVQRLFYWHVLKAFYRPDLSLDEMNHVNFDWYAPINCHRQSIEEVRRWCGEASLAIERENVQEAGITIIARKTG
jgi:SAM-dependent methyltransferase